jgi:hypothetical protein
MQHKDYIDSGDYIDDDDIDSRRYKLLDGRIRIRRRLNQLRISDRTVNAVEGSLFVLNLKND